MCMHSGTGALYRARDPDLAQVQKKPATAREGTCMGKRKGKACYENSNKNKAERRSAEAHLRRSDTRVSTTVETDLRQALELAPRTEQVQPRPASSWLAAAHLAQAALSASGPNPALGAEPRTTQGALPADSQSASTPDTESVSKEVAL